MPDHFNHRLPHQRLDAYRVAVELFVGVEELMLGLPNGHADMRDQLRRAAAATPRNIAEGANRYRARDKVARYIVAHAECGEAEAVLEMAERIGIVDVVRSRALRVLAARVSAMLHKLIESLGDRGSG